MGILIRRAGAVMAACAAVLAVVYLLQGGRESRAVAGPAVVQASADNWGLSFPEEGESPVGNATAEALAEYGTIPVINGLTDDISVGFYTFSKFDRDINLNNYLPDMRQRQPL